MWSWFIWNFIFLFISSGNRFACYIAFQLLYHFRWPRAALRLSQITLFREKSGISQNFSGLILYNKVIRYVFVLLYIMSIFFPVIQPQRSNFRVWIVKMWLALAGYSPFVSHLVLLLFSRCLKTRRDPSPAPPASRPSVLFLRQINIRFILVYMPRQMISNLGKFPMTLDLAWALVCMSNMAVD